MSGKYVNKREAARVVRVRASHVLFIAWIVRAQSAGTRFCRMDGITDRLQKHIIKNALVQILLANIAKISSVILTIPGGSKKWLGVSGGSPGGPLGSPGWPLGG